MTHEVESTLLSKRDHVVVLNLLHTLISDPNGQTEIHTFFKDLEEKDHTSLTREGHTCHTYQCEHIRGVQERQTASTLDHLGREQAP